MMLPWDADATLELSLYGGYLDEGGRSEDLTLDLLAFYHRLPMVKRRTSMYIVSTTKKRKRFLNYAEEFDGLHVTKTA